MPSALETSGRIYLTILNGTLTTRREGIDMRHTINGNQFITLFYVPEINRCVDGVGNVVHDIFRFVTPNQYRLFREHKGMGQVRDITNTFTVVLLYLEDGKIQ